MEIKASDTFFKSYKKMINSECWWKWEFYKHKYYDIKRAIKNLIKYFNVVTKMCPWDSHGMILMMHHQAKILLNNLEKYSYETKRTLTPKIKKLKRFVELSNNYIEDNHAERCGYDHDAEEIKWIPVKENSDLSEMIMEKKKGYEHIDNTKAIKDGHELEKKEWEEMMNILKNEMRGWWD